jgi:hypothetical protein
MIGYTAPKPVRAKDATRVSQMRPVSSLNCGYFSTAVPGKNS